MEKKLTQKQIKEQNKQILEKIEEYNNNGKTTIAIFCDAYYPTVDGVIKVFENHAQMLSKDNNVIVCVPKHKNKLAPSDIKPNYLIIGVNSVTVSSVGYDCAFPNSDVFFNKAMRKARIDVIHLHSPFTMGVYAVTLAKRKKIPVIGSFHSLYKQDFYKATKNNAISQMLTNIIIDVYNKCSLVVTMNSYSAGILREYGYKGPIRLIPNSVGWTIYKDVDKEKKEIKEKYNLKDDEFIFTFVGRLIIQKQILFIADVLKILKEKNVKFKMFFIGKGVDGDKLKNKIKEYNLEDNVIMTGVVRDDRIKSAILSLTDLFVFPSTYDTDGIVKIEAACMNVPTICAENTGTASIIKDEINGFVSPLDVNIFSQRILDIINDKEKLKRVGEGAFKDLYITWDKIGEMLKELYKEEIAKNTIKRIKNARKFKKNTK